MTQATGKMMLGFTNDTRNDARYVELIQEFLPRPILTEQDLQATQVRIDYLLDQEELTIEEQDYLNVLGSLVRDYEAINHSFTKVDPIELLHALLEESEQQPRDLLPIFGQESILAEIRQRQRELTIAQVKQLADFFQISPSAFLG
jgi:HTH-type transcriptional regulator / antitoxin HigA